MSRPEGFVLPVGSLGEATAGLLWQSPSYVELVVPNTPIFGPIQLLCSSMNQQDMIHRGKKNPCIKWDASHP